MCVVKKRGLPEYCVKVAQNLLLRIGNCSIGTVRNPKSDSQVIESPRPLHFLPFKFSYHPCHSKSNFLQVRTGCGPGGRWHARKDGQEQGKTNVILPKLTLLSFLMVCTVAKRGPILGTFYHLFYPLPLPTSHLTLPSPG